MIALLLLAAMLSQSTTLENRLVLSPSFNTISLATDDDDQPVCKVPDADEYEPCAWQDERAAEAEKAEREKTAKAKCRLGGCLVVRQEVNMAYTTNPPIYPPNWRCDCKAKPRQAKGAQKK